MNLSTVILAYLESVSGIGRKGVSGFTGIFALIAFFSTPLHALQTNPSSLCDNAAQIAARETGVPVSVLRAITITETGRNYSGQFGPWPWTVNMEGAGHWFSTPEEARDFVEKKVALGARSFDVGCFQLNHRWHGQAFASIEQMFDPIRNARYAAGFLKQLHKETGDWSLAAGAYHSRTPKLAEKYRARFDRLRARLEGSPQLAPAVASVIADAERPRVNTFPLLQSPATPGRLGSLVSIGGQSAAARLIAWE